MPSYIYVYAIGDFKIERGAVVVFHFSHSGKTKHKRKKNELVGRQNDARYWKPLQKTKKREKEKFGRKIAKAEM